MSTIRPAALERASAVYRYDAPPWAEQLVQAVHEAIGSRRRFSELDPSARQRAAKGVAARAAELQKPGRDLFHWSSMVTCAIAEGLYGKGPELAPERLARVIDLVHEWAADNRASLSRFDELGRHTGDPVHPKFPPARLVQDALGRRGRRTARPRACSTPLNPAREADRLEGPRRPILGLKR